MTQRRSRADRVADTVARLEREDNVWLATASFEGVPHAVPFSLWWSGERIAVATPADSPTVRNIVATGRTRAMLEDTADVVIIDGIPHVESYDDVPADIATPFVERVGWDPGAEPGEWSMIWLTPMRVLAWNSIDEHDGRTIMSDGVWAT